MHDGLGQPPDGTPNQFRGKEVNKWELKRYWEREQKSDQQLIEIWVSMEDGMSWTKVESIGDASERTNERVNTPMNEWAH